MNSFIFENPTKIIFGNDRLNLMPEEISRFGSRILFLYGGGSIKRSGLYDEILQQFSKANVFYIEHGGVVGNARLSHAREGVKLIRQHNLDLIVAIGGGSVIDEAKAIAAGACYDGDVWDFYERKAAVTEALPIIAMQTLPATASEMNGFSVLTHDDTLEKCPIAGAPILNPRVSFLDPAYTYTLSKEQTGIAAADIISHCTEGYFTTSADEVRPLDGMIESLVATVIDSVHKIQKNPADSAARSSMMWSATLGWNGTVQMGIPGMQLPCHSLEMPLSGLYDIAHGAGLSILTPQWMRAKADVHGERIRLFGSRCLGVTDGGVEGVASAMENLYKSFGAPLKMSDIGDFDIDIDRLTYDASKALRTRGVVGYDEGVIKEIYQNI